MSETDFLKHVYGRTIKHELKPIASFDPRDHLNTKGMCQLSWSRTWRKYVKGMGIGILMLLHRYGQNALTQTF